MPDESLLSFTDLWSETYYGRQDHLKDSITALTTSPNMQTAAAAKSLQLCPTLCDPRDGSPWGFSVHGIFQARVLEWGAIAFSEYANI